MGLFKRKAGIYRPKFPKGLRKVIDRFRLRKAIKQVETNRIEEPLQQPRINTGMKKEGRLKRWLTQRRERKATKRIQKALKAINR